MAQEEDKEPLSLEPQPTIKILQVIKVIGRTVVCCKCKKIAVNYCACGSFLCLMDTASHSCLVRSSLSYSDDLLEALA
jgi:hypothetical protein